jgi:hypothetical protein
MVVPLIELCSILLHLPLFFKLYIFCFTRFLDEGQSILSVHMIQRCLYIPV